MIRYLQKKPITIQIKLLLIAIAAISISHIETLPFYAENVLQATNLSVFYQQKQNILNFEKQTNQIDYKRRVKIFSQDNNDSSNNYNSIRNYFFATPEKIYDESGNGERRLNALMLIILMVSITAFVLVIHRRYTPIKWLLLLFILAQAILIPFNCGILGSTYQYPVISLDYTEKDKPMHKDGVFLLAKSPDSVIIYERLNFFQISYIPQTSITNMNQVFTSSIFSNCGNGDIKPCEIYAIIQP